MKQTIVGLIALIVLAPSLVFAAGSGTLSVSAPLVAAKTGELFDVGISGNAGNEGIDTVRAVLTFDPTMVRVQSVRLTGSFDHAAPGNYLDNKNGKISWGAFTLAKPVNGAFSFATVTFLAVKEGTVSISVSSDSHMIHDGEEKIDVTSLKATDVTLASSPLVEPGSPLLTVSSTSNATETDWYANNKVEMSWVVLQAEKSVDHFLVAFDETSNTDPTGSVPVKTLSKTYLSVKDGIHYFHIKGALKGGGFTPTVHRKAQVDVTAPNDFVVTPTDAQVIEGESVWLTFATTDETAGVTQYQMAINDSAFQVQESPLEMTDLKAGTYFFRVGAFDRAGNIKYSGVSVRVYPAGTDLSRPENYAQSQVIASPLPETAPQPTESQSKFTLKNLLITLVLVALSAFGIIYVKKFKKR